MFKISLGKLGKTEKKRLKEFIRSEAFLVKMLNNDFDEYKRIKELAIFNCIWHNESVKNNK